MPPPRPHPVIVVDLPVGRIEQPVLPGVDPVDLITRLAPVIPTTATWSIQPPNHGKVTGDPRDPAQGDPP